MSDEVPKVHETLRPPEGDEDVYSASTKVGEAAPEILELVRQAEAEAALKPPRVPGAAAAAAAASASDTKATTPPPPGHPGHPGHPGASVASEPPSATSAPRGDDVATDSAVVAAQVPPSTGANVVASARPVLSAQGVPPLSIVVLAAAVAVAGWLGYQAMHVTPATPATPGTPPGAFVR